MGLSHNLLMAVTPGIPLAGNGKKELCHARRHHILHAGHRTYALRDEAPVHFHYTMLPLFLVNPPPCISYANVHNYYGPYTYCSLAINSGMFSDRSPPTDLCPLIQCIHRHGGEAAVAVHPPIRRQRRRHGSSG